MVCHSEPLPFVISTEGAKGAEVEKSSVPILRSSVWRRPKNPCGRSLDSFANAQSLEMTKKGKVGMTKTLLAFLAFDEFVDGAIAVS